MNERVGNNGKWIHLYTRPFIIDLFAIDEQTWDYDGLAFRGGEKCTSSMITYPSCSLSTEIFTTVMLIDIEAVVYQ